MDKIKEMGEGIVVQDAPVHKTTKDDVMAKGKRSATTGNSVHAFTKVGYATVYDLTKILTRNNSGVNSMQIIPTHCF